MSENRSGMRYTVVKQSDSALDIVWIEEQDYTPIGWHALQYFFDSERIEPDLRDECIRAQVLAFCRSYRKRFAI